MKFSSTKIFIYALVSTILIFSILKLNISPKEKIIDPIIARILATKSVHDMEEELCLKSSEDLQDFYKKTSSDYTFNPDTEDKFLNDLILKLANGSSFEISTDEIVDYSKDNSLLVVVIILMVILFLFWIPYTICVCSRRCCCVPDSCVENNNNSFLIVALVLSVAISICCFIGYSQNTDILQGIFGLGCSILKIEYHLAEGDEYKEVHPYWIGIVKIVDKLSSTIEQLQNISDNYNGINLIFGETKANFSNFKTSIKNEWDNRNTETISNPIPDESNISPLYMQNYGPQNNDETYLGSIENELNIYEDKTTKLLSDIINVIDLKSHNIDGVKNSLRTTSDELNNSIKKIEDAITSTIGEYYDYFDDVDTYVRKIMNILFSLNLAIAVFFGVSILFLLCCKCGGIFVCISWFFIYIFMLFSMFLGCVLGIVSAFIKGASSATKYLIQDNIKKINFGETDVLDSCLNGNGSLSNVGAISLNFDSSIVDNIYHLENNITNGINTIDKIKMITISENAKIYDGLLENPQTAAKQLKTALNDINKYVNSNIDDSKVSTETPIYDTWEVTIKDCGDKYYPNPNTKSLRNLKEVKDECLVITEWSEDEIEERYKDILSNNGINITVKAADYLKSIKNFMNSNTNLINQIKDTNNKFNESFNDIMRSEKEILNKVKDTITPLRRLYEDVIKDGSIFDIMNCKFVKRDVNKVIAVLYDEFGGPFKTTSNLFIAISVAEILLTLFVLIIMKGLRVQSTTIPDYSKYSQFRGK